MDNLNQQRKYFSMTRVIALVLTGLLLSQHSLAQSLSEFEQWKKQYLGEFKKFKDERDREFANFLNQKWKNFDTEAGRIRDKKPKPVKIPIAKPIPDSETKTSKPEIVLELVKVEPVPVPPVKPVVIAQPQTSKTRKFDFLGYRLSVADGLSNAITPFNARVSQQSIQLKFTELAQSDYPITIKNLRYLRHQLKLNDWGYMQLIQQFTDTLHIPLKNKNIVSWFLLLKSGLNSRVAFADDQVFLLLAVRQALYDISFFKFENQKYYVVSQQKRLPNQLSSYDGHYPKKLKLSDFRFETAINSKQDTTSKRFNFTFKGKTYHLTIPYNSNTLEFLSTYPQMDIDQYFRSPLDGATATALLDQLGPMIQNSTEQQAVNLLLRFVQTAFKYQTDGDQFGRENYLFIEETIFYPASDCEDRSILFAWLARNLLGLEVVGLDFPGHIATAIRLKKPLGVAIYHQKKRYTIADPTYINALAGMKMPQYKKINPKVIPIL